jgi:hypothetical protein
MRNTVKFIVLAGVFFCMSAGMVKAEDSSFSYKVSSDYDLTLTLRNADKINIYNSVRYHRGGSPSLDAIVDSRLAGSSSTRYYMTTIEAYNENTKKVIFSKSGKGSFEWKSFITSLNNVTVTILIERIEGSSAPSSNQFSIKYCEDAKAPVVTISRGGASIDDKLVTNQLPVELIGSALDDGVGVNDGTWSNKLGSANAVNGNRFSANSEFNESVSFQVNDRLGNTGTKTITVIADKTPPTVGITSRFPTSGEWSKGSGFDFIPSANDALSGVNATSWQYSTDGGSTWSEERGTFMLYIDTEGEYDLRFRVRDHAGNVGVRSAMCRIDKTAPVVSITANPSGEWAKGPVTFTATASDALSGVNPNTWQYSVNNGLTWSAEGTTRELTLTSEGKGNVFFRVKDLAGNIGSGVISYGIDQIPPVVGITSKPSNEWTSESKLVFTAFASDNLSGVNPNTWQYSVNNGLTWSAEGTTREATVTAEALHNVHFRVKDLAGNTSANSLARGIDRTPPALEIKGDWGDSWSANSQETLGISVQDALSGLASLEYSLTNGFAWTSLSLSQTTLAVSGEGQHTVVFRAKDKRGNTSQASARVNIDTSPPSYALAGDGHPRREGSGWIVPVTVSGLSDTGSGIDYGSFKYAIDGGALTKVPGSFSGSSFAVSLSAASLSGGSHAMKLTAADKAGNTTEKTLSFSVDATPPAITGGSLLGDTANGAPWTNQDRFTYSITDGETGMKSHTVTVNTVLSAGYVSPFSGYSDTGTALVFKSDAPDGTYQVLLSATDNANNVGEKFFYCRLDRTKPVINSTLIKSASRSVTISGTDALSGLNSGNCWTSTLAGTSGASGYTVNLSDGSYSQEFTLKDIAGNSVTKTVAIYVEQSPPNVAVTAPKYGSADKLPATVSITTAVMAISDVWYTLDGVKTVLGKTNWGSFEIPLASCAEGVHTIKVGATTEVGVSGESVSRQFIIDRTEPQLKGYELRDVDNPGHIIAAGEYIPGTAVLAKIAGEDFYNDGAKKSQGDIQYYSWAITRKLSDTPVFASDKQSTGNEFTLRNFSDGLNYLCIRAADGAGNLSQTLKITVLQDRSSPGAPVIKSSTHAEAFRAEQASSISRAEFGLFPAFGVKSGIKAYQWKVEKLYVLNNNAGSAVKVREGEASEIDQEGGSGLSVELSDNDENEFYQLLARCVGGNGKAGPWTTYRFRIDSEAPGALIVQAVPQADSSSWYNQGDALARWNKPSDMTGVAEYRYIVLDDEENQNSPLERRDASSWEKTQNTQVKVNLKTIVGAKKSGKLRIGVSAVDYSGNSKLGQFFFGYDFVPPKFNQSALVISNAEDSMGAGKRVRWGGIKDGESGPDRIVIVVSSDGTTSAFTVRPELAEYIVSPLEENKVFTIVVRAYDRAGNKTELYDVCATGNATIPSVYFVPYLETINGYDLSGKKRIEGGKISLEELILQIPEGLELSAIAAGNGAKIKNPLGEIPLGTISAKDGMFQTGKSAGGTYELRSGGFVLEASALSFSSDRGLDLENAVYARPVIVSGAKQERRISLGLVNAGNPPLMQFNSGSSAVGVEARIESVYRENSGETQSGFALTGVGSLFLSDGKEWFGGAGISFDRKPLTDMAIRLEDNQGKAALKSSSMEALSNNLAALLDISAQKPLSLALGNVVYRVVKAGIRGDLLDIYEAVLPLPAGYEPSELTVRNITIDTRTKVVREGPDFSAGTIVAPGPEGVKFEGTMIRVDSRGNLLVTGYVSSDAYGIYRTENLVLSGQGIDWSVGAEITGFSAEVHGFFLNAQKARVTASGILIPEGKIDVWGNLQTVTALGLRSDRKDAVWKDGAIAGTFYGDPGYGSEVQMSGGRVADEGVFANATLPLGDSLVDATGAKSWTLPGARLYPNIVMTGSFPGEKKLVVANLPVRAENCFFDEQGLQIGKAWVEGVPNLTPETFAFTGMGFTYQGLSAEGVSENNFLLAASGWQVSYASLGFDGQGIKGRGSLKLPKKLGDGALAFPDTRITAGGIFVSGSSGETQEILRFHGIPVFAAGVELKVLNGAHALELASPWISLKPINGPDIGFGKTVFDAEGRVLLGEHETKKIDFVSFNGYRIGLENAGIDDQGFFLEGAVSLQLFGKSVVVSGGTFRMLPDLSVSGTGPDTGLTYNFGDWSISGKDVAFDVDRIRIGSNRVLFREIEFDIGEIPFGPDGRLLQEVVKEQNSGVSLFGTGAKLVETRLSEEGIEAAVIIALPSVLGGKSFVFDRVGFKANGDFWVEKKVDKFNFEALGFSFALEELAMDKFGLGAAKASITLPASMEAVNFSVQDLTISADGKVGIGNATVTPFTLWNMNFNLNSFSIVNGEAEFKGKVSLPSALPGELSGREIQIKDFRASLGGGITALDISLDGDYTVPFSEAWKLLLRNVRISYAGGQPWISADRTELLFPKEYAAKNGYVDQVKFNPLSGKFVFSEISFVTDIAMNFWGVDFALNKLKIDSSYSIEFGGSARFSDTGFPAFLAGKTVAFNRFEIKANGTLGAVDIKLEGLEGGVIPGFSGLALKKGSVSLLKQGDKSLILDIGGTIALDASMPASLAGAALKIETFTYDTAAKEIKRLKATAVLPTANFLGNFFSKLSIGIDWNEAKQTGFFNLAGNLILPSSFPAFLAGKEAKISNFKIGFDGAIQSITAKYATEKNKAYDAFGFLQLSNVAIEAALKSGVMKFDLDGTVILPATKFPQGIGGLSATIAMEFDTLSGLKTASAQAKMPDSKLFGSMEVSGGTIGISKLEGKALEISVGGSVALPSFFPEGLRGVALNIRALTLNTSGEILDVDIGVSGLGIKIFGAADLVNGSISFKKGEGSEFLVNVGGAIRLSAAEAPDGLRNAELEIRTLELSTRNGLRSFDAGIKGNLEFSILGGVRITVTSLALSETGISMGAFAKLPANYPNGLADTQFALSSLQLGWNGALRDIQGGVKKWSMTLAGFAATIDELYFDKDAAGQFQVALKSCKIQIPKNFGSFGGQYVAIKNAKFSPRDGSFLGDIEVSKIETEIAGFKLILDKPSLSFSGSLINFSKVTLKLPEFLGKGEVALKKVTLSAAAGMQVSGGAFKLPNFNVGLFAFNDVKVEFSISNSQYALEGSGSVIIPGAGNISASLAFTTKSATYPIGLKRAEFSYSLNVGGIPLGATGLVINGIAGGISYGPPDEVPSLVRGLFNDTGPRMKVGLSVGDSRGGSIISMTPATWVDLHGGSWAFEGRAAVLKGSLNITADVTAGLGAGGFAGQVAVDIKFARGSVTVYVFDKAGDVIMSGEGKVEFGIPRGFIIDAWIIKIPSSSIWIAKVNAAFGRFTNGETGIKGTVDVPILGSVGAFVGSGGLKLGSLSSYTIEKPSWSQSFRFFSDDNIDSYDARDSSGNEDALYQFFVPPKGSGTAAPSGLLQGEYGENETMPGSGLDRLVVVLEYPDGAPELRVVSPLGIEYSEGSEGCETLVEENGVVMIVYSAEAGIWQLRVKGLEAEAYHLSALGSMAMPLLELEEPSLLPDSVAKTQSEVRVRGKTEKGMNSVRVFARETTELPGFDLGSYAVDAEGRFDMMVPLGDLDDGEYLIYAELDGSGVEFSPAAYAPGKILLDRSALPLLAPLARVAETDSGVLSLRWQNTNAGRSKGYKVKIYDHGEETESILYVGNVIALDLPGYSTEQELSFSVAALDNAGLMGPWSEPVSIRPGQERPLVNRPVALVERVEAKGFSGGFIEGVIRADIANFRESSDASGYVGIRYAGPPLAQSLNVHFGSTALVSRQGVEIPWFMGIDESVAPGLYEYPCEFFNEANGALNAPFVLAVELSWPAPQIAWVDPGEISGIEETPLVVHGSGFVPGTRVFLRDEELAILDSDSGSIRVNVPPRFSAAEAQKSDTERGELVIQSPGGGKAVFPVTVLLPTYNLSLYARSAETTPGGRADYAIAVESLNGFEGNLSFRVIEEPAELKIILPEFTLKPGAASSAAAGAIAIQVREDALPGSYSAVIEGDGGKLFELVVLARSETPLPALSSVVPRAAYSGDTVHVYGNNLGKEGKLFVNYRDTPVSSWSEGEIVFVVPDDAMSGAVHVLSAGAESNALSFTVRDRGFELRPAANILELSAGEEKTMPLALRGHEDTISLSLVSEPGAPFTAALSKTELKLDEPLELAVKADAFAGNGSWVVVIHGESRGFEAAVEIRVVIDGSLRIVTAQLPDGLVDAGYYAELASQNVRGALSYHVAGGNFPPGISMTPQGIISGRPAENGRYQMDVEARDSLGWKDKRSFVITVWEENWGQAGKDGGNTRFVRTDLSANADTAWIYGGEEPVVQLLGAENRIIAMGSNTLFALNAGNGSLSWSVPGTYKTILCAGTKLYALAEGGRLEIRDPLSGALLWTRDNIEGISSNGAIVLEETATRRFFRNAERGTLIKEQRKGEGAILPTLWHYGAAYSLRDNALVSLYGPGTAWDAGEKILAAAADTRGGAAITNNFLILFDRNMAEIRRIAAAHGRGATLSLTDEGVSVLSGGSLKSYDRGDLRFQWAYRTRDGVMLANGLEKTLVAGPDGLTVLNRYDGNVIWRDEKAYTSFALYDGRIVASDASGAITAFNGVPNVAGPLTELRIDPPSPGESLWYTRLPRVEITSADRETYVAQILMRHNNGPWIDAPESFTPEEGEHHIAVHGVDSRGLAGAEARLQFRVDTGLPESSIGVYPKEPESGWHNGPVTLSIEAWDDVSGIDWIWTSSSAYTGPALLSDQGIHRFSWQALDRAGNREPLKEIEIRIDSEPPLAEVSVVYDRGLAELAVAASDSLSGLAFIECRINDGAPERYGEPLVFAEPGAYRVGYRAFDRAGNGGDWRYCDVFIPPDNAAAELIDTPLVNGMPRKVMIRARNGMPLVDKGRGEDQEFNPGDPEAMTNLPSYTLGAEYIRWDFDDALFDEGASIRFRVKRNVVVYLFLPRNVPAPRGWSFVEDRAGINRLYYSGGAAVYMRRYGAGALAELPGTPAGTALPLIMAQEKGGLAADILIRRESGGEALVLDALVQPRQYSRRLPLQRRWFVNAGEGWEALEGNRYEAAAPVEAPLEEETVAAPLRFRLELFTPDGEVERRVEKVYKEEDGF